MQITQQSSASFLIRAMTTGDFAALLPDLERVKLSRGQVLTVPHQPVLQVHFPEGGIISVVAELSGTLPTETGMVGREGMSGLSAVLGSSTAPSRKIVQIDGHESLRIETARFLAHIDQSRTLRALILKYAHTRMVQIAHSLVSYAHCGMEARLARWLLMCCDRIDGDDLHLTHEFMSQMIGAHRSTVTVTLHSLEGFGAIRSTRGVVTIRDRKKLEELAGEAYGASEAEYRRLIGDFAPSGACGGAGG